MAFRRGEDAQSCGVGRISSSINIKFFSQSANILRLVVDDREHPAKEEQIACLYSFGVSAKGRRGVRELNAKVLKPLICTAWLETFTAYHRPACAPPSTCSTSPVT